MTKKLYNFFKKIIVSFFMLFGYNILVPATAIIPINVITVLLITFFNLPVLFILIILKLTIY